MESDQIPLVESYGLEKVEDFRDQFTGQSDYEIYKWAWNEYGEQTSKDFIVWMGGRPSPRMEPGVADFGIYEGAFFTDQ